MTTAEMGSLALALMLIIGSANLMGHLFLRMRQPKIVGEILAGILIGPMILAKLVPSVASLFGAKGSVAAGVLSFLYSLGLLLLMFVSGSAARRTGSSPRRTGAPRRGCWPSARRCRSSSGWAFPGSCRSGR
jgi:hypothetical protein